MPNKAFRVTLMDVGKPTANNRLYYPDVIERAIRAVKRPMHGQLRVITALTPNPLFVDLADYVRIDSSLLSHTLTDFKIENFKLTALLKPWDNPNGDLVRRFYLEGNLKFVPRIIMHDHVSAGTITVAKSAEFITFDVISNVQPISNKKLPKTQLMKRLARWMRDEDGDLVLVLFGLITITKYRDSVLVSLFGNLRRKPALRPAGRWQGKYMPDIERDGG